ncbi:MAG: hypothetical protein L6Q97_13150 [Thermoanaerobaculia bacterium]|nr:hypothetical protein [Thermoanaerobaculia bacterium]
MVFLGNFFLGLATLFFFGLFYNLLFKKMPGGDAGVGHAWAILILVAGFCVCMAIVAAIIGQKGGFAWLGSSSTMRFLTATGGFLLTLAGFFFYTETGGGGSGISGIIRKISVVLLPLLLLGWGAIHLNDGLRAFLPAALPRWLSIVTFVVGSIPVITFYAGRKMQTFSALANRGELDSFEQGLVQRIDSTDVMTGMGSLLVHTPASRKRIIREKALAKIKSRPDWQEELARLLTTRWAPEALGFLAHNEVENKALLANAVSEGIFVQAAEIRRGIRDANHRDNLYAGQFYSEVSAVLEVLKHFKDTGIDYRPAVQELRNAFYEPCRYDKPDFKAPELLDKWLKQ